MPARIFKPAKTAMQSGKAKTDDWILEFEQQTPRHIEPLMGYTSSSDTMTQLRMHFDTLEEAITYCERNGVEYTVQKPHEPRRRQASYSDNFAYVRKQPWTH